MAATYERLDYGSPDGSRWGGASTDAIAFYGATPATQMGVSTNVVLGLVSTGGGVTTWGLDTSSNLLQILNAVSTMANRLGSTGLFRNLE